MATSTKAPPRTTMDVLTLSEAAAYLRVDEETVKQLVREQGLPGRQVGADWRFLKEGINEWLKGPSPKEKMLGMAGDFKNDPFLPQLQAELARG
jgi:excisionase family DNA binding protein